MKGEMVGRLEDNYYFRCRRRRRRVDGEHWVVPMEALPFPGRNARMGFLSVDREGLVKMERQAASS